MGAILVAAVMVETVTATAQVRAPGITVIATGVDGDVGMMWDLQKTIRGRLIQTATRIMSLGRLACQRVLLPDMDWNTGVQRPAFLEHDAITF